MQQRRIEEMIEFKITPNPPNKYDGLDWESCGDNTIFTDKNSTIRLIEYWNGVDEYYDENEQLYRTTGEPDAIAEVKKSKKVQKDLFLVRTAKLVILLPMTVKVISHK
jgi:hypothetical protein